MQIKKRYFVVALVLLLGLTTVTFANPQEEMGSKKTAKGISERVTNEKVEEHSYSEALEAVEEAEENPTVETVETARTEIRNANDATEEQVENLQQRVDVVEETIDVAALVKEVETLAEVKETRETAKEKYTNAETEVNKLEEGEVKTNLTLRLTKVSKFLNDTTTPKITGITNGSVVNKSENIYVSDEFLYNVKITGPNSKGEVVTKEFIEKDFTIDENNETYTMKYKANYEGKWTIVATDKLGNTTTETFTIDRTKAKRVYSTVRVNKKEYEENKTKYYYVKNGDSFEFAISFTEMLAQAPTVTIGGRELEMKLNEKVYTKENKVLYEGTFKIPANEKELKQGALEIKVSNVKDLAGNESTEETVINQTKTSNGRTVIYDCKNPVIAGVNNKYFYNKGIKITQVDYIVHNVSPIETATIDGKPYELGTEYKEEGKHFFEAYDRAGNRVGVNFTIDLTAPEFVVEKGYNENGTNPYIKLKDETELTFKLYRKGTETPIHEFDSTTTGKSFKIGWHGAGVYTLVVTDQAKNETSKEFEVYHNLNSVNALEKAFKDGGKAVLTKDVTLDKAVILDKDSKLEIDLNGYELKISNTENSSARLIKNNGNLTIKNGKLVNDKIYSYGIVDNYGTILVENVKVQDNGSYDGSTIKNRNGKVTVKDSEFTIISSVGYKTDEANKNIKYGNASIYSDGELVVDNVKITTDSERAYALLVNSGKANIKDVTANGHHGGLGITGGEVTVNDMYYESNVHYGIYISNNSEANVTINGGTFVGQLQGLLIYNEKDKGDVKVTINDGTFKSKTGKPAAEVIKSKATHKMELIVKGGTFENTKLNKDYIAKGYRQTSEGRVVKENAITTSEEMIEAISEGGKFELAADLELTDKPLVITKGKEVEIDLNGKTITGRSTNASASKLIEVVNGATLKLTGKGTVDFTAGKPDTNWGSEGQPQYPGYASNTIVNKGTLVIDGPTIINNTGKGGASYVIDNYPGADLTVEDGVIYQKGGDQAIRVFANSGAEKSVNITINGGEIKGYRAIWIQLPSNNNTAPVVNLTVNGGKLISTDSTYYYAIYTWSAGQSGKNITARFNGGEVSGYTVFSAYKSDKDKETVILNGTKFNDYIGRWTGSAWADI